MYYEVFVYKQGGRATMDEAMLILASVLDQKPEDELWANELWDQIDTYHQPPVVVRDAHDPKQPFDETTLIAAARKSWGATGSKDDLWDASIVGSPTGERFACVIGMKSPKSTTLPALLARQPGPQTFGTLDVRPEDFFRH